MESQVHDNLVSEQAALGYGLCAQLCQEMLQNIAKLRRSQDLYYEDMKNKLEKLKLLLNQSTRLQRVAPKLEIPDFGSEYATKENEETVEHKLEVPKTEIGKPAILSELEIQVEDVKHLDSRRNLVQIEESSEGVKIGLELDFQKMVENAFYGAYKDSRHVCKLFDEISQTDFLYLYVLVERPRTEFCKLGESSCQLNFSALDCSLLLLETKEEVAARGMQPRPSNSLRVTAEEVMKLLKHKWPPDPHMLAIQVFGFLLDDNCDLESISLFMDMAVGLLAAAYLISVRHLAIMGHILCYNPRNQSKEESVEEFTEFPIYSWAFPFVIHSLYKIRTLFLSAREIGWMLEPE